MTKRVLALILLSALYSVRVIAQSDSSRIRTTFNMLGIGKTSLLDTYLSQEKFSGTGISFLHISETPSNAGWATVLQHEADLSYTHDRAEKAKEMEGDYGIYWGRFRQWKLGDSWKIMLGGLLNGNIGFTYNTVNSNNPAQARLSFQVMPSAIVKKTFSMFGRNGAIRYEAELPLLGLGFSPNYGQSYYEIFSRGNYDHNIVPTTIISTPSLRHQLYAEWNATGTWSLCIGYLGNYQQAKVNNLKSHIYTHRLMLGIVKRFQILRYRP